jgi:hypothetical protein
VGVEIDPVSLPWTVSVAAISVVCRVIDTRLLGTLGLFKVIAPYYHVFKKLFTLLVAPR